MGKGIISFSASITEEMQLDAAFLNYTEIQLEGFGSAVWTVKIKIQELKSQSIFVADK